MRFKIDENPPREAAEQLSSAGHDAVTIYDQQLVGQPDPRVATVCQVEQRALVTLDIDFADIRAYPPADFHGIVVLRPRTQAKAPVLALIERMISLLAAEPLENNLWIVHETGLRIRQGERSCDADP